ncbi:MAG: hypothetical protein ACRELA_18980 [Candidatus Rokuibacteriota bacterium]
MSLTIHLAAVAGIPAVPGPPWSWLLHAGTVAGFVGLSARITAAGLRSPAGCLRMRRMVPIPLRLALGVATLNAGFGMGLAVIGRAMPGQAASAYWTMMYLLVTIVYAFVVSQAHALGDPPVPPAGPKRVCE